MKKKKLTTDEMIDALVEADVEMFKNDDITIEEIARTGWKGWEEFNYTDKQIKEEYENRIAPYAFDND
ncbi:MAG TPA: hypothetical protein VGT05_02565 [Patescibacteria group bacterium]|nr:hypothetical protein [Patescibacteria group bacterium]